MLAEVKTIFLSAVIAAAVVVAPTGAASAAPTVRVVDPNGDVTPADLDLTSVIVSREGANFVIKFTTRGAITSNVIYCVAGQTTTKFLSPPRRRREQTSFFVSLRLQQHLCGGFDPRPHSDAHRARALGVDPTRFRFSATAEPTNGRRGPTDRVPNGTRTVRFVS